MGYKRQCDNWLTDFGRWTLPRSEAPETFIFWTGLFNLSAALRRRVVISRKWLGSWSCSPNLYIMFVAGAGKARKSTTANYAEELLFEVPEVTRSPELITKESLLTTLVRSQDASMAILAPEFGEFIVKSGVEMYGFLTNMYDGKRNITASTLSRGVEFAEKPCVNLLGATTPEWLADNMPESVIGGGFASRVIFIYEERVRHRQLFYTELNHKAIDAIGEKLKEDLQHIALNINGEFELTDKAKDFMEGWYRRTADAGTADEYKMHGYYERRPAHVFKTAMLLHIAYSDELLLQKQDFEHAIALMEQLEKNLPKTFRSVGRNQYTVDMERILDFIAERGKVKKAEIHAAFRHTAMPSVLDELLDGLLSAQFITVKVEGTNTYFSTGETVR